MYAVAAGQLHLQLIFPLASELLVINLLLPFRFLELLPNNSTLQPFVLSSFKGRNILRFGDDAKSERIAAVGFYSYQLSHHIVARLLSLVVERSHKYSIFVKNQIFKIFILL